MSKRQKRETSFELLRIIAMFMIIGDHLFRHGVIHAETDAQYVLWSNGDTITQLIGSWFLPGGRVGVAIFFMITGFFSCGREHGLSIKRVMKTSIDYAMSLT